MISHPTTSSEPDDLARTAVERSNLYGFLAQIYRQEPSGEFLRRIREPEFAAALAGAGTHLGDDFFASGEDELSEDLAVEFTRLFIGPGPHVSPHASVHMNGQGGELWSAATIAAKRFIEASGLAYDPKYRGLPDHLGVELEFMSALARGEAEAWERGRFDAALRYVDCEHDFLVDHLAPWVPTFCDKVVAAADHPFYRRMARLTADFIRAEREGIAGRKADAETLAAA